MWNPKLILEVWLVYLSIPIPFFDQNFHIPRRHGVIPQDKRGYWYIGNFELKGKYRIYNEILVRIGGTVWKRKIVEILYYKENGSSHFHSLHLSIFNNTKYNNYFVWIDYRQLQKKRKWNKYWIYIYKIDTQKKVTYHPKKPETTFYMCQSKTDTINKISFKRQKSYICIKYKCIYIYQYLVSYIFSICGIFHCGWVFFFILLTPVFIKTWTYEHTEIDIFFYYENAVLPLNIRNVILHTCALLTQYVYKHNIE